MDSVKAVAAIPHASTAWHPTGSRRACCQALNQWGSVLCLCVMVVNAGVSPGNYLCQSKRLVVKEVGGTLAKKPISRLILRGGSRTGGKDRADCFSPYETASLRELETALETDPEYKGEDALVEHETYEDTAPAYEKLSVADCLTPEELPYKHFEFVHDHDQEIREEDIDWSEECLWCSTEWKRNVKLLQASRDGDFEMVLSALEEGAAVNGVDVTHQNWTALHYAGYYGYADIVERLVDSGADLDPTDVLGWTPLHYAALKGRHDACLALLNCGANATAETLTGKSVLQKAVYLQHVEIIELLCEWIGEDPKEHVQAQVPTQEEREYVLDLDAEEYEKSMFQAPTIVSSSEGEEDKDVDGDPAASSGQEEQPENGADITQQDKANEDAQAIRNEYEKRFREWKNKDGQYGND